MRLKTLSVFCLFLFLLAISPASANGFESGLVGWSPSTDFSDTASASAQGFVNIYTADAYAGTKSVQVTAYAKNSQYYTMVLELGSGVDLTNINTLSFWQKTFDILNPSGTAKGFVCIDDTQVWTMSSGANYASWTNTSIDVSGYTGTHSIQFKCTAISTGEEEKYSWLLDNVAIDGHLVPVGTASRNFYVSDSSTGTAISGATVTVTASEEGSLTTAANGYTTHFTALVSTHTYSYTITKSGYATKTGTFTTGWEDSGTVYATMTAEATPTPTPGTLQISSYSPAYTGAENYHHVKITTTDTTHDGGQTSGTWTVPAGVTSADILVVAGGGGGASRHGGGGGAGGLIYTENYALTSGSYVVIIGHGGGGNSGTQGSGSDGGNTLFDDIITYGGGGGAYWGNNGRAGGSGGGAGGPNHIGGECVDGTGFPGGSTNYTIDVPYAAGGGGGAGSIGETATQSDVSGNGGAGLLYFGSYYAAGGGGGGIYDEITSCTAGSGGSSIGGDGGHGGDGSNAVSDTGSGGGGGGYSDTNTNNGGDGANGVIIIRYAIAPATPTPTATATAATPTPLPSITVPTYQITTHHEAAEVTLAESYNLMPAMYMLIILLFLGAVLGRK